MKSLIKAVAIAAVFAIPAVSFAQSNQPVTRAQIRTELQQLESVGYNPSISNDEDYPADIQAAEARVAAKYGTQNSSYGPAMNGSSQSGAAVAPIAAPTSAAPDNQSVFFGH
ncbi:DUF4148 domain-containing protein [Paraburkholderia phosphatilytica]|uniref:DUF4148 domain-containing protein n=1 Tax=Paraburkholderia phosphatilytica TaxID=2282883 RepID=UPI000E485731|nr:DUF4148 domain-containing protein [Paraburkholderia phosphatilytica]